MKTHLSSECLPAGITGNMIDGVSMRAYNRGMENLQDEFKKLRRIDNDFKRRLYFAGILTKYPGKKKIMPVIVGGHAVEFYTLGSYTTGDIDIVSGGQPEYCKIAWIVGLRENRQIVDSSGE